MYNVEIYPSYKKKLTNIKIYHKQKENKQTSYVNTIYNTLPNWYRKNNKNNNTVKILINITKYSLKLSTKLKEVL